MADDRPNTVAEEEEKVLAKRLGRLLVAALRTALLEPSRTLFSV